jgi:hypothetical protein
VHDRRIDGIPHTFGNAGALFMNAMTWYDHETESIWSQPWGRAIKGAHKGVVLNLLPFQLTSWGSWKEAFPETLVMIDDIDRLNSRRQRFEFDFVIGLTLGQVSKAYYYTDVLQANVINDTLGEVPVVIWASGDIYQAYIRQAGGNVLTFRVEGQNLVDNETGSTWDAVRGLAIAGALEGESLQPVPSLSSYDWAWEDFYPESEFYKP